MKFILFAALLLNQACYAQAKKYFAVTDSIPEVYLPRVLGQEKGIHTSAYAGKLLVIDFWSLGCISCVASFPKLDSLQQQFGDRLQILLVTRDPLQKVQSFFDRRKIKLPGIPIIAEDSVLSRFFYYDGVPHLVWINEQRKVQFITGGQEFSALSLSHYFSGAPLSFAEQKLLPDFNEDEPLWKEGGGRLAHHVKYYSLLSGYLEEHTNTYARIYDDSSGIYGLKVLNMPLAELYKIAYGGVRYTGEFSKKSRILFEVKDKVPFHSPSLLFKDPWLRRHSYCYEAFIPAVDEQQFCRYIQQDLTKFFPYVVSVEKRCQRVIVLESTGSLHHHVAPQGKRSFEFDAENNLLSLRHVRSSEIGSRLRLYFDATCQIFVDLSGNQFIGDISLSFPFHDWKATALELEQAGLRLTEKDMEIDMLVIRDKPALPLH